MPDRSREGGGCRSASRRPWTPARRAARHRPAAGRPTRRPGRLPGRPAPRRRLRRRGTSLRPAPRGLRGRTRPRSRGHRLGCQPVAALAGPVHGAIVGPELEPQGRLARDRRLDTLVVGPKRVVVLAGRGPHDLQRAGAVGDALLARAVESSNDTISQPSIRDARRGTPSEAATSSGAGGAVVPALAPSCAGFRPLVPLEAVTASLPPRPA